jgi:hypothetical protein
MKGIDKAGFENQRINPMQSKLPRQRCHTAPDAWVRVSFAHTRVSIVGWIYDPDHSLPPGMNVDVPHLDCLLVAAPITLEGLDHVILKPKQLDGIRTRCHDELRYGL